MKPAATVTNLETLHQRLGTRTIKAFRTLENLQMVNVPAGLDVDGLH